MPLLVGIDVGTTGARAVVIGDDGEVRGAGSAEYPIRTPRPGWAEQDPEAWWNGVSISVRSALAEAGARRSEIAAAGLSGQMHSLVLLGGAGQVLRPAILWNDQRTAPECAEITERVGRERLLAITCNPALTGFTAPKILWVRRHDPEAYARVATVLLPKDYVRFRLTGARATEVSDASGTCLLNVPQRRWSDEMLRVLDVPAGWLPSCAESPVVSSQVHGAGEAATGLPAGTPVAGGGGDQAAQGVGTGIVRAGLVSVTIGTSGVVFTARDVPTMDAQTRTHTFCHAVPGQWHIMGVVLSAGGALRWLRETVAPDLGYEELAEEAATIAPGARHLLFLPYLSGERTPHADPAARGAFVGLSLAHGRGHLVRAVMEGVAFGLRDSFEILRDMGLRTGQVRISGGGSRDTVWRQIIADVLQTEVVTMNMAEGAAYGAALLGGVGAGVFSTVEEACDATLRPVTRTEPIVANQQVYESLYGTYKALYPALRSAFLRLAEPTTT